MTAYVRGATAHDLEYLEDIENRADKILIERLHPATWHPAPTVSERMRFDGFVLVASVTEESNPVGFAHVIEFDDAAHLEQLSVLPESGRQGVGRMLVNAAMDEAAHRGYSSITLRTFANLPWNAPFYSSCGFVESEPVSAFELELLVAEHAVGIDALGRRVQMSACLGNRK